MDIDSLLDALKKRVAGPSEAILKKLYFLRRAFKAGDGLDPQVGDLIRRAFEFANKAHEGQKRKSGGPYIEHSYDTAMKLIEWRLDPPTIIAGLLHDVAEDTAIGLDKIKSEFGEEVAFLVEGVTKLGHVKYRGVKASATYESKKTDITKKDYMRQAQYKSKKDYTGQAENLRKMILALGQDLRVILIKLADRLHNMKTLNSLPLQKQKRIALETYDIYAPLAYRLGMQDLAGELDDLSFPCLYPEEYQWLIENVKERYEEREKYLNSVMPIVIEAMRENKVKLVNIDFRAKRYSSLYKKLKRYDMNLESIYDLVAMRIVVETVEDCYAALGTLHKLWPPMPGRIKDYIALPKQNGYQSIHTTVFCVDQKPTEFQIRTMRMHEEAENGIAAHWLYEEKKGESSYLERKAVVADRRELAWVAQIREWQKEFADSEEFIESLKIDFLRDRIFVITPKGEVIDLPAGATPVDFAYRIHSELGDQCSGARVNGRIMPLDRELQSGDVVEILVQKGKKPSESWLKSVKTELAKKRIRAVVREKRRILTR